MRNLKLLETFDQAFKPLDIAEPIRHIKGSSSLNDFKSFFDSNNTFDLLFFANHKNQVTEYLRRKDLDKPFKKPLFPDKIIGVNTDLLTLTEIISLSGFVTLIEGNRIVWLISWQDLNKAPYTDWVYSQLSLLERQFKKILGSKKNIKELILIHLGKDTLTKILGEYNRRKDNKSDLTLTHVLSFWQALELGRKIGLFDAVLLNFSGKSNSEQFLKQITRYRNDAAHGQLIIRKFEEVRILYENILIVRDTLINEFN